jgi:hypothetical protein
VRAHVGLLTGLFGAAFLAIGVFLPCYGISGFLTVNFYDLHYPLNWRSPDALEQVAPLVMVGAGALLGLLFSLSRLYALAGFGGMLALSGVVFAAWRITNLAHHANPSLPLLFGFQWGWGVLLFGSILLIATEFMPRR